jgi:hypothetical protein
MSSWQVQASPADFERLRDDERFAALLALCRIANLLRSVLSLAMPHDTPSESAAQRSRMSATLLLTGLLAEALPGLERYGRHFRHLPAYSEQVVPLTTDPARKPLTDGWIRPVRNQAVFHHDPVVSTEGLKLMRPAVPQSLAEGSTTALMDVYYPTADVVAAMYLIQQAGAIDDPSAFLGDSVRTVASFAVRMCEALDALIGQALSDFGFTRSDCSEPHANER